MSITPVGGRGIEPAPRGVKRTGGSSGFSLVETPGETGAAAESGVPGGVLALDALLSLQEVEPQPSRTPQERNRQAHRRAGRLLDGLRRLQLIFLGDPADSLTIGELGRLTAEAGEAGRQAADPGLREVVAEIELVAERHLARLRADAAGLISGGIPPG